ncbi:MAG: tetratricopeptide repeat protein [Treponema sp.]|jgi:tetratricopeptide (TPR) repeat protein|nr:tetratricopeptide repeat protein [Treponema sp.]
MFTFLKRPLYVLSNKIHRPSGKETLTKEKWIADFSNQKKSCFDIKSEISFDANLENKSLVLGLKKKNHIAWLETDRQYYEDQVIEARFRLDGMGGYAAAGIMFRVIEPGAYYIALISSKGYFRLDVVQSGAPRPLIGWTEAPGLSEKGTNLTIIARAEKIIFVVNGRWIAETADTSIPGGHPGFALVSYDEAGKDDDDPADDDIAHNGADSGIKDTFSGNHVCRAYLDYLSLDSRAGTVEGYYEKWNTDAEISAESRLRLAETFAALDKCAEALEQIHKAWKRREAAAASVTATYTEMRSRRELLLAARMAGRLEQYDEAEEYINACLALDSICSAGPSAENEVSSAEIFVSEEAFAEKAKILSVTRNYSELKKFLPDYIARRKNDSTLYALLGHAHWNLNEYGAASAAWIRACDIDHENGLYAANAANACEMLGRTDEALRLRLAGGRIFLRQGNYDELGVLIPKLLAVGENNWEAHALAGKWAFGIEDFDQAEAGLARSDGIRRKLRPAPEADPAVAYLRGLLLLRQGKPAGAVRFFEEAVRLAPDYGLFRFKLAQTIYLLTGSAHDAELAAHIQAAVKLMPGDGDVKQFAEKIDRARKETAPPAAEYSGDALGDTGAKKTAAAQPKKSGTEKSAKTGTAEPEKKPRAKTGTSGGKTGAQETALTKKSAAPGTTKPKPAAASAKTKAAASGPVQKTAAPGKKPKAAAAKPALTETVKKTRTTAARTPPQKSGTKGSAKTGTAKPEKKTRAKTDTSAGKTAAKKSAPVKKSAAGTTKSKPAAVSAKTKAAVSVPAKKPAAAKKTRTTG